MSRERAQSVLAYLQLNGVASGRMNTNGYGESQPVSENGTTEGRKQNRRVDIAIMANKKLKKAAENGEIGLNNTK